MKGVITVDIGTTSMRGALYDAAGRLVHMDQQDNAPRYFSDGRVEQDASAWQAILPRVLKSCADAAGSAGLAPACIAVTAQRSSVIPIDRDGTPLHPAIMWQDRRTAELVEALREHDPLVYRTTGPENLAGVLGRQDDLVQAAPARRLEPHAQDDRHPGLGAVPADRPAGDRPHLRQPGPTCSTCVPESGTRNCCGCSACRPAMLCELVAPGAIVGGLLPARAAEGRTAGRPAGGHGGRRPAMRGAGARPVLRRARRHQHRHRFPT